MKTTTAVSNNVLSEALLKYQLERIDRKYPSIQDCNQ